MKFRYKALDRSGSPRSGTVDAANMNAAVVALKQRGLTTTSIEPEGAGSLFTTRIPFFDRVPQRDIVILSRQISTLFEAQVSALRAFTLLAAETPNALLRKKLFEIADALKGGNSISQSLARHPDIFSDFYVSMVRSGEESGKLDRTFLYLADYLDRSYEITTKVRNALIYPAFVVVVFVVVMVLMLTLVIPKISTILLETGQELPIYTRIILGTSDFFTNYGIFLLILLLVGAGFFWRYVQTPVGRQFVSHLKLSVPYFRTLFQKLYLARIADNFNTLLTSGISVVQSLEITAEIVDNEVYRSILLDASKSVKTGKSLSDSLAAHPEIPGIMVQMVLVGEETGELGNILGTMAKFYNREVSNAVDTLINLIEPAMILVLGLGVGILLAAVLLPIYNISAGF